MTQLTASQRDILNSLREEIEKFVIQENEVLTRLGSEFGHCAVASEAFFLPIFESVFRGTFMAKEQILS